MSTISQIDNWYLSQEEPTRSCLLALRDLIIEQDDQITMAWKYGMPFFCYKGKMFAYLWVHKQLHQPYIGIVEGKKIDHPQLIQEKRARMKIMLIDPNRDIPVKTIRQLLKQVLKLYV